MHKTIKNLILFFFFLFFVSCQSITPQIAKDHLRYHLSSEPATLNPILATDAYASRINQFVFDTLIDRDPDTLEYRPKIAKSWTISSDKKVYTFYLRKDVKWHDGKPVTADDVVFSYDLIMHPKVQNPHLKGYYKDIAEVRKIDDYTVRFVYKTVYFKAMTFCGMMDILPKHLLEGKEESLAQIEFSRFPLGNGPYKFKEWITNNRIVLVRNEDYWGEKPEIRILEFKIIPDSTIALQILKKGELDVIGLRPIQWMRQTDSQKFLQQFQKIKYPYPGYSYIGWNNNRFFFKDPRVRRAMTHMINREKINERLNYGLAQIVSGPFVPFSPQYDTSIKPLDYNIQKAKELLAEAGWKDSDGDGILEKEGKKFEFTFIHPASKTIERISTILKEDLAKIGVKMDIIQMEWGAFLERIVNKKNFDATSLSWSSSIESDPYQVWHSSSANEERSSNFIVFKSKKVDRLMEQARVEFDDKKRNALYHQVHKLIHDLQPYTFLYNSPALVAVSKRFTNVKAHALGLDLLEWKVASE